MDAHANLAVSAVATAPSPATSGTSLVVTAGQGTRFPAAPFNATVWPATARPDPSNAEIVRVTARSTDTLTITRAQESTSARTIVVGDVIAATVTAKTLTDVETDLEFGFSQFMPLTDFRGGIINAGALAATYLCAASYPANFAVAGVSSGIVVFYLDPADYPGGTRTTKIRLEAFIETNAVSPGTMTFTVNLSPIATWGGASGANPTVASLSAATTTVAFASPGANAHSRAVSSVVTFPNAGFFAITVTTNATIAANATAIVGGRLAVQRA